MALETTSFDIEGPLLIHGVRHHDERGYFSETYQLEKFKELGLPNFVQDNLSSSARGVFRGLHWQAAPYGQGKLVTCVQGEIIDFVVDVRVESPTYMEQLSVSLGSKNLQSFWVPEGFAHGFLSLSEGALVQYKVTNFWNKESERSLSYKCLPLSDFIRSDELIISEKDLSAEEQLGKGD